MTDTRSATHRLRGLLLAILALVAIGATIDVNGSVRHQLALSFIPQPSDYTELYFATGRPVEVDADGDVATVNVEFTVANHEGVTTVYPYTVALTDAAGVPVARVAGAMSIPNDDAITRQVAVAVPISASWTAVDVHLQDRTERLHLLQSQWTTLLNHSGSLSRGAVEGTHEDTTGAGDSTGRS
ncbi:hypothetical protein MMAD_10400 [Mycolicibacterium madagascariense]|uniref:DUF1616 domain-containing protein n=1 Tax=Mycolicibacterium madagascariense TaxID=212765 RepID=A0A7I7XBP9_9MYCO|nr:hypothetical protein [Mycolicibacterium madagascariense]MCV7011365.1 hypothetical protein [Mycolicibacterium madagascariense]BBZ26745.1 hypothetical protein MMAD_10400 [Mycolicibacterium madagascariense]